MFLENTVNYTEKFDIVFSNAVFHWIEDHLSLLKRIYLCLKPGGKALLQMGGKGNASEIIELLSSMITTNTWKKYFTNFKFPYHFYSPEDYLKWSNQTGFNPSRIELVPKQMEHNSVTELEGWIRTTWLPYLKTIPKERRTIFIREFAERYLKLFPADNKGLIRVGMIRLEVELLKPHI